MTGSVNISELRRRVEALEGDLKLVRPSLSEVREELARQGPAALETIARLDHRVSVVALKQDDIKSCLVEIEGVLGVKPTDTGLIDDVDDVIRRVKALEAATAAYVTKMEELSSSESAWWPWLREVLKKPLTYFLLVLVIALATYLGVTWGAVTGP